MENPELKILRDKCLLFNKFLLESGQIPAELKDAYNQSDRLIEAAYLKGDIRPLKSMSTDIDDQLRQMPLNMAIELKKLFKEQLNINLEAVERARLKAIEKIQKKGRIVNAEEYELIHNRVEEIYTDPDKEEEVKLLNKLLTTYIP